MLKLIRQELIDKIFEAIAKGIEEKSFPVTFAFGFETSDYEDKWRECCKALMRQVIAPLLEKYELSNVAFYDDLSFEFTIEEKRETFI